jgi:hypothetical protein
MVVPMNARRRHHRRTTPRSWLGVWLAASLLLAGQVIRAEDDIAVDDIDPAIVQRKQQQQANRYDLAANFDANIFGQVNGFSLRTNAVRAEVRAETDGGGDQSPQSRALAFVGRLGEARLARIDAICGLTDAQRRKLRLALESDVRRLLEEIETVRTKYAGAAVNLGDQEGQRKWQEFQQDAQRCRQLLHGLSGEESLFAKVLPTTLDAEQQTRLATEIAARRSYHWRTLVAAAMRKHDDMLGLDQGQYDEIEKLLLDREPPLRVEGPMNRNLQGMQHMLVFMVLSEVDANRLQSVLNDRQWNVLAQLANQGKAMRSYIEAQGLLEKGAK